MALYQVPKRKRGRWYCGPAALAAVTGCEFEEIRAAINSRRKRPANRGVCGVGRFEMSLALGDLAPNLIVDLRADLDPSPTFRQWRKARRNRSDFAIVAVGHHWVALNSTCLVDNKNPEGVRVQDAGYERRRVRHTILAWKRRP